ncbi:unnamed protein product [Thelazia callipaeda]|uniref:PIGO_PIGG domain-containing protein n=1 Tax=Thelazia callipaeda TaxID=103827 RepID=A0A0N5DAY1_THECL|nr:unnamed protein product [Thelazia callipaeda]
MAVFPCESIAEVWTDWEWDDGLIHWWISILSFTHGEDYISNSTFKECTDSSLLEKKLPKQMVAKVVIIIIDAWQERFFFHQKSMQFLHQLISNGQAVAFSARVQSPTVTMPRIKAATTGMIPSFVDIVRNFASDSISSDNIIDQLKNKGYRCRFCGDDTWLRLFPNRFDNLSVGVTSFYVSDFKEVDENVTACMRASFENNAFRKWDLVILHYLGLDHIVPGHSLGGMHKEIDIKLHEMDVVIQEIYLKLQEVYSMYNILQTCHSNFSVIVFGDHGMTESGSHGGSSKLETYVPVVYIDGKNRSAGNKVLSGAFLSLIFVKLQILVPSIEQIDIVPTLATLFNVPIPKKNLGITFLPYLATDNSDPFVLLSLLRNCEQFQMLGTISDKLHDYISDLSSVLREYCARNTVTNCSRLVRNCMQKLREIQSKLIRDGTAYGSQSAINLAIFMQFLLFAEFFASSLIEEEHDLQVSRKRKACHKILTLLCIIFIHRFCRGYVESSRRRWVMEEDILPSNGTGWISYYEILTSIGSFNNVPDPSNLLFILSFYRITFLLAFFGNIFLLLKLRNCFLCMVLWVIFIMRAHNLPLAILNLVLGYCLTSVDASPLLVIRAVYSSFFYLGNSNSFSTIDIAVGFAGVKTYQPVIIALQIMLNTYSGPLLIIFGWWQSFVGQSSKLLSQKLQTALLCYMSFVVHFNISFCMLSLCIQRYHLFIWSTFAPKFLYEFAHLITLTLVTLSLLTVHKFSIN